MATRKLTAEEAAAAEAVQDAAPGAAADPSTQSGSVRLATPPFVDTFTVPGLTIVTADGVELDAATAETVRAAAAASGITLREV